MYYHYHLDHHNDYLQIYLIEEEKGYILTDDGWILDEINHLISDDGSSELIAKILQRFGIDRNQVEISIRTDLANLTQTKNNFMQTINVLNEFSYKT